MPSTSNGSSLAAWAFVALNLFTHVTRAEQPPEHHFVRIVGEGNVSIILVSGLGDTHEAWSDVQQQIAQDCARTIAYNRAGYPASPPAVGARDAKHIVEELRSELRHLQIRSPYVLVGHSLGGLYMQYFARHYPQEVRGLVLVDSTHWDQQLVLNARTSSAAPTGRRTLVFMPWIARRELIDSTRAGEQVNASPRPGSLPTFVLSSTRPARGETPSTRTAAARLQEDIAADFPAARHVRVAGSGHYIQHDQPDVVIDAVREVAGCSRRSARHRSW